MEESYDEDWLFRLIDETLIEGELTQAQEPIDVQPPPYPVETEIPGLQLLEEDDSFYAGTTLRDVETNNVSDILAVGDSMFHRVKFVNRPRAQAGKVSFGDGRIPEIKIYLQSTGMKRRSVLILCMGHNDILKRRKKGKNISLEHIFKLYVAFIEWATNRYQPEVIFLCTLVPVMMEPQFNLEAEVINKYIHDYGSHNKNVVVLDVYQRIATEVRGRWEEFYDSKLLHPNEQRGAPLMNDLLNLAVDYYLQDKQEVLTSVRVTTTQPQEDYFRGT